jgi:hypothetical protein
MGMLLKASLLATVGLLSLVHVRSPSIQVRTLSHTDSNQAHDHTRENAHKVRGLSVEVDAEKIGAAGAAAGPLFKTISEVVTVEAKALYVNWKVYRIMADLSSDQPVSVVTQTTYVLGGVVTVTDLTTITTTIDAPAPSAPAAVAGSGAAGAVGGQSNDPPAAANPVPGESKTAIACKEATDIT